MEIFRIRAMMGLLPQADDFIAGRERFNFLFWGGPQPEEPDELAAPGEAGEGGGAGMFPNEPQAVNRGRMTECTLNGVPCLSFAPVRWSLRAGVEPVIETFYFSKEDGREFLNFPRANQPITLRMLVRYPGGRGDQEKDIEFKGLYIIDFPPPPNPYVTAVRVADRRYWWQYSWSLRRFNMTRRIGTQRLEDGGGAQLQPAVERRGFKKFSLRNDAAGNPEQWDWEHMIKAVFTDASLAEHEATGEKPEILLESLEIEGRPNQPFENIAIDDRGDQALARVLEYAPGVGIFLDADGQVIAYKESERGPGDVEAGADASLFREDPVAYQSGGVTADVLNWRTRPSSIRVSFTYECEVRFDFAELSEETDDDNGRRTIKPGDNLELNAESRLLTNVLPLPDFSLVVTDTANNITSTEAAGTWIEINQDLFNAWGQPNNLFQGAGGTLTFDMIRRGALPFLDLWGVVGLAGLVQPEEDWMGRVSAIQQHWRKTFQLPALWLDRIIDFKPTRAGMMHSVTGTRSRATAYCDYCIVPSQRVYMSLRAGAGQAVDNMFVMNVRGYRETLAAMTTAAPIALHVVDSEQGIFTYSFTPSEGRMFQNFLPGTVADDKSPQGVFKHGANGARPVGWDVVQEGVSVPGLDPEWKFSTILTLTPGAPNHMGQCFTIDVPYEDIVENLPIGMMEGGRNAEAEGPVMEVHVPTNVATARVAWFDPEAETVKRIFGIGRDDDEKDALELLTDRMNLSALITPRVVNLLSDARRERFHDEGENLLQLAQSYASSIYWEYLDHTEGHATTDIQYPAKVSILESPGNRAVSRAGWGPGKFCAQVIFEVGPDGRASTSVSYPEKIPKLSMWSFMDENTRQAVMHLTPIGGG